MNVSMNELKAALSRCFEATGYSVGSYEDAADMILWLEKHGLGGLDELKSALPYIHQDGDRPPGSVVYEDSSSAIIDNNGRSALNSIAAAIDLAHAKAIGAGMATVTIHNCHNRKAVLKALTSCGRCGISVIAYWQNGSDIVTEHTASIKNGDRYPSYSEVKTTMINDLADKHALTIICSSGIDLTSSLRTCDACGQIRYISPEQLAACAESTVDNGIRIDAGLWATVNRIGTGILVKDNDRSRQGAGS